MRDIILGFWVVVSFCLASIEAATTSSASWQYPNVDGLIVNYIDTIFLQWTSNFPTAYLQMWCQNGTTGNNVVLGSQSPVVSSGRFGYVLTNQDQSQAAFPVACHAAIVSSPAGGGVDAPFGITFTSQLKVAAQTFSLSASTTSSSSATTTSTSAPSTSASSASVQTQSFTSASSSTVQTSSTTVGSNTDPTALAGSATSSSSSSSTAVKSPTSVTASSNNLGPIIGGVIGGLALLCFIVFGAMFLRTYQRDPSKEDVPSSTAKSGWWHKREYRTTEMQTGGLHEIEGDNSVLHEKEGTTPAARYEKEGDFAKRYEVDGRAKSKRWTVFELPT